MASPAANYSSVLESARAKLAGVAGVDRIVGDEAGLILVCRPGIRRDELRRHVDAALAEAGIAGPDLNLEIVIRPDDEPRQRVRFVAVEVQNEGLGMTRVRVTLELRGETYVGESVGESGQPLEIRTAAAAAVAALNRVAPESLAVRFVGVKQVRAFDADILVVALMSEERPPRKFVGAVLVGDAPHRAAAAAVLHATNRLLGNYVSVGQ